MLPVDCLLSSWIKIWKNNFKTSVQKLLTINGKGHHHLIFMDSLLVILYFKIFVNIGFRAIDNFIYYYNCTKIEYKYSS